MFKICTIVGTRPEIIKLSSLLKKLDKFFDHKLIHTGQNYDYELNQIFFEDLKLRKPDFFLNSADSNPNKTISKIFSKIDSILNKNRYTKFISLFCLTLSLVISINERVNFNDILISLAATGVFVIIAKPRDNFHN